MHPRMEPASDIMVPKAEKMVMARNIPSMDEITSHVSTGTKQNKTKRLKGTYFVS